MRVAQVVGHLHGAGPYRKRARRPGRTATRSPPRSVAGHRERQLHHLADPDGVLLGPGPGLGVAGGLGPDVGDRLLGIGDDEGPPVGLGDLDAVDQDHGHGPAIRSTAVRITIPFCSHGVTHLLVGDVDGREAGRQLRQALAGRGQHAEQVDEGGHGVEGGEEAGEDEAPRSGWRRR